MEWVLAAYLGAAHTLSAPLTVTQPSLGTVIRFDRVAYDDRAFDSPPYYGYRVSYFPSSASTVGVEAEMIHLKAYAQTNRIAHVSGTYRHDAVNGAIPVDAVVQRFSISHGLNLLLANVAARRTILRRFDRSPRVQVVGRLGAGPTLPHAESTIDSVAHEGYERGPFAWQASGAVEVRLSAAFAIGAEYKFTRTTQSVPIDQGEVRGTFASHHGVVGIAWHVK